MSYIPAEREQPSAANAPSIFNTAYAAIKGGRAPQQRKNGPGGQRNPLKTLDSDKAIKEIQAFSFDLLCSGLAGFCWIWLYFGFGLDLPWPGTAEWVR